MLRERVAVYVDGFNLYHGLDGLKAPHLKWVNLRKLANLLIRRRTQKIVRVCYFSAFATYYKNTPLEARLHRHEAYLAALEAKGVVPFMGNFAKRELRYVGKGYKATWRRREEKQTDVAIGVSILRDAFRDEFDTALIVSCDTDMLPVFRVCKAEFPNKRFVTVAPPEREHHQTLIALADDSRAIKRSQVERSLFGPVVRKNGVIVARRPASYRPPR